MKAAAATTQLRKLLANETSLKGFKKLGLEFSLLGKEVRSFLIIGEKRKLSASRPDMSSQELMVSGKSERGGLGSDQRVLGSQTEVGKIELRVKQAGRVGGVVAE